MSENEMIDCPHCEGWGGHLIELDNGRAGKRDGCVYCHGTGEVTPEEPRGPHCQWCQAKTPDACCCGEIATNH